MKAVLKAAIKKEDKYLIVHRPAYLKHFPEHWDFPGGKIEPGEDKTSGLKREVFEETNLDIEISDLVSKRTGMLSGEINEFEVYDAKIKKIPENGLSPPQAGGVLRPFSRFAIGIF